MPLSRLVAISWIACALRCRRLSGVSSCAKTSGARSNWQAIEIDAIRNPGHLTYSIMLSRIVAGWQARLDLPKYYVCVVCDIVRYQTVLIHTGIPFVQADISQKLAGRDRCPGDPGCPKCTEVFDPRHGSGGGIERHRHARAADSQLVPARSVADRKS